MIYGLIGAVLLDIIFLILFIRSVIENGKLKINNEWLKQNADIKQKQLEIAANHPDTPADLAKRMRDGTL